MTITKNWSIYTVKRELSTGKIIEATVECTAVDSDEPSITPPQEFYNVAFDGDVTIPYANVTESDLVGWCKNVLGTEEVVRIEALSVNALSTAYGLPWVTQ